MAFRRLCQRAMGTRRRRGPSVDPASAGTSSSVELHGQTLATSVAVPPLSPYSSLKASPTYLRRWPVLGLIVATVVLLSRLARGPLLFPSHSGPDVEVVFRSRV